MQRISLLWRHYFVAAAMLGCLLPFLLPPSVCFGVAFQDRTADFYPAGLGGKAAWGDYNKDGWVDLCAGGTVLRNNVGLSFTNINWSSGSDGLWGDFNNDGHLDLFGYSNKSLLQNNGGNGFLNATSKIPSFGTHTSRGAAWADLNNDTYLDLYVGGYEVWQPTTYPDKILTYDNASQQFNATWQETAYRARGVTAADFDRDGDQDVYVSNYRQQPNRLWENGGTGAMTDVAVARDVAGDNPPVAPSLNAYGHTIGSAWGDLDNDGYLDLFVGNFNHHDYRYSDEAKFLRNPGDSGPFQLMGELDGADWQESYASPALADYDNDGDLDLFFTTVYATASGGIPNYPRLYRNDGNWQFTNVTNSVGLGGLGPTYQAAWADVDNDGDLDLATSGKMFISDAHASGNHWLRINLEGNGTTVNRSAIGAQVRVFAGGQTMTRQVEGGTGEGNQNDLTLHYGLGSYTGSVSVDVLWPDGTSQTFTGVGTDQTFAIAEPEPSAQAALVDLDTGNVIWADNYETGTVGSEPLPTQPQVGAYQAINPYGATSWILNQDAGTARIAPCEGTKMLGIFVDTQVSGTALPTPFLNVQGITANSGAGDLIELQYAVYIANKGSTTRFMSSATGAIMAQLNLYGENGSQNAGTVLLADVTPGAPYPPWTVLNQTCLVDDWNHVNVQHVNGTTDWSISINGQTPETVATTAIPTGAWDIIQFRGHDYDSLAYYDAVPDVPDAISWTGIGGMTWSTATGLNNWKDSLGTAVDYTDGIDVTFDDTTTGLTADISATDVTPGVVVFNNSTKDFTVTGTQGIAGTTGLTKQGTGKATLNSANSYTGLTTVEAGTLQLGLNAQSPVLTGGGADIQGGEIVLDYTGGSTPAAFVQAALTASYATGFASGQIYSSTATSDIGLGWVDDSGAKELTITRAMYGDANLDGSVNFTDLSKLLAGYNQAGDWAQGDFDYTGAVAFADLSKMLANYNQSLPGSIDIGYYNLDGAAIQALSDAGITVVPEPSTLILLGIGALGMSAYVWRRHRS